jgi:tetratricopeptide (TPR) repeat protein
MRLWILHIAVTMVSLAGCGRSVDPALYAKFQTAQQTFDQATEREHFMLSAALYDEILNEGIASGAVLYNQGNAYMRAGETGRAIACYRRAKRYRPRDPFLDANLRYAIGNESTKRSKPFVEYVLFWQDWISYPGKFQLSCLAALLTFAVAAATLFVQPTWLKRIALALLLVTLAITISSAYDWYRFQHLKHGVVVADQVVARKGNSEAYEPAFTKPLAEGAEFRVLEQRGDWLLVRLGDSQEGWVPAKEVVVY